MLQLNVNCFGPSALQSTEQHCQSDGFFAYINLQVKIYETTISLVPYGCETWSLHWEKQIEIVSEQGAEENIWG